MGVSIVGESIDCSILQWFHECILYLFLLFFGTNHCVLKYYIKIELYQYPNWLHYFTNRFVCCRGRCRGTDPVCSYYNQTTCVYCCEKNCMCIEYSRIPVETYIRSWLSSTRHDTTHCLVTPSSSPFLFFLFLCLSFYNYLIFNCREKRLILWEELYVYWVQYVNGRIPIKTYTYVLLCLRPLNDSSFVRKA